MSEIKICDFCKNTGVHLCPDVAEPILVKCSHKSCPITTLQKQISELEEQAHALVSALRNYEACQDFNEEYSAKQTIEAYEAWKIGREK